MIALHAHKLLIYTPPRTASLSLHMTLCQPPYNGIWLVGPAGDNPKDYDHHLTWIDPVQKDWRRVVVVRDELDRLVSLWHHLVEFVAATYAAAACDFATYVKLAHVNDTSLHWIYRWSIRRWAVPLLPFDTVRFEHLDDDLSQLIGPFKLRRHDNRTVMRRPAAAYYHDPTIKRLAEEWASR